MSHYVLGHSKTFFFFFAGNVVYEKIIINHFYLNLSIRGKSRPKELFKISRCFRSHFVSLFESF